jgi:hypothetical protein
MVFIDPSMLGQGLNSLCQGEAGLADGNFEISP